MKTKWQPLTKAYILIVRGRPAGTFEYTAKQEPILSVTQELLSTQAKDKFPTLIPDC